MRKLIFSILCLTGIAMADVYTELSKLEAEQRVLQLKIENYKLQKQVVEYEDYLVEKRKSEIKKRERESALIQLREDLRRRHSASDMNPYPSSG